MSLYGGPEGKRDKSLFVRVSATDLGWWCDTREGNKGPWKPC